MSSRRLTGVAPQTYVDIRDPTEEELATSSRFSPNCNLLKLCRHFAAPQNKEEKKRLILGLSTRTMARAKLYQSFSDLQGVDKRTWTRYLKQYGVPNSANDPQTTASTAQDASEQEEAAGEQEEEGGGERAGAGSEHTIVDLDSCEQARRCASLLRREWPAVYPLSEWSVAVTRLFDVSGAIITRRGKTLGICEIFPRLLYILSDAYGLSPWTLDLNHARGSWSAWLQALSRIQTLAATLIRHTCQSHPAV